MAYIANALGNQLVNPNIVKPPTLTPSNYANMPINQQQSLASQISGGTTNILSQPTSITDALSRQATTIPPTPQASTANTFARLGGQTQNDLGPSVTDNTTTPPPLVPSADTGAGIKTMFDELIQGAKTAQDKAAADKATSDSASAGKVVTTGTDTGTITNPPAYAPTDNTGLIQQNTQSVIDAIKAQIQQSINDKNAAISGLPSTYDPLRATSEVQKAQEQQTALEQAINAGDRGGIGRQNVLATQTAGEQRLNAINLQQEAQKASLQNDIANLTQQGNVQEAQAKSQELQQLIDNQNQMNQNAMQWAGITGYLPSGEQTMAGKQATAGIAGTEASTAQTIAQTKEMTDPNSMTNQAKAIGLATDKLNYQIQDKTTQAQIDSIIADAKSKQINNQTAQAQLDELTNPNSVTNQMKQIGLDTANINYSILDKTQQSQVDSVLADLQGKNINNQQAQYQLNQLTDPNSVTNQINKIDLAQKNQDYISSVAQYGEWLKTAPQRLATLNSQVAQAKSSTDLAKLQVQVESEDLLAKKIDVSNMNQNQKDAHAKALQDIASAKANISQQARQLNISQGNLDLEKSKFKASTTAQKAVTANIKPYTDYIDKYFAAGSTTQDITTGKTTTSKSFDQKAAAQYIIDTGLDDATKQTLLSQYGLPTDPNSLKQLLRR